MKRDERGAGASGWMRRAAFRSSTAGSDPQRQGDHQCCCTGEKTSSARFRTYNNRHFSQNTTAAPAIAQKQFRKETISWVMVSLKRLYVAGILFFSNQLYILSWACPAETQGMVAGRYRRTAKWRQAFGTAGRKPA